MSKVAINVAEGKVVEVVSDSTDVETAFAVYGDEIEKIDIVCDPSMINDYESRCTFTSETLASDEAAAE